MHKSMKSISKKTSYNNSKKSHIYYNKSIDDKSEQKMNKTLNKIKSNNQCNGLNNNILNISENELFNFELDQSTESIITNQSISNQIPIENPSNKKNILKRNEKKKSIYLPLIF